jgi:hypothetical protein
MKWIRLCEDKIFDKKIKSHNADIATHAQNEKMDTSNITNLDDAHGREGVPGSREEAGLHRPRPSLSSYYTVGSLDRNWNRREAATPAPPRAIPSAL